MWPLAVSKLLTLSGQMDHKPMASGGYTCHLLQLGDSRQLSPRISTRNQSLAQIGTDSCPHESQTSSMPGRVAWTIYINMASSSIWCHGDPSRRSNPKSGPFLILGLCCYPELGFLLASQQVGGLLCAYISSLLLYDISTRLGNDSIPISGLTFTRYCHHISGSASLHSMHTVLSFCLSHLSITHLFFVVVSIT